MDITENDSDYHYIIPPYKYITEKYKDVFYSIFKKPIIWFVGLSGFDVIHLVNTTFYRDRDIEEYINLTNEECIEKKFGKNASILINDILSYQSQIIEKWATINNI